MKPPFSLLVVHGDGSRVLRLRLPRWIAYGALGSLGAVLATAVGLSGEYLYLRRESGQLAALRRRVDGQREVIDAYQTGLASVRTEVVAWKAMHARMWESLGPAVGSSQTTGVGGAAPTQTAAAAPRRLADLHFLTSSMAEEGPRLRELEHAISRTGRIMSALPLRLPVRGPVNSEYGLRQSPWTGKAEQHEGIDIASAPGTPVESPAAGTVVAARSGGDYGKQVVLDHGHGVRSRYAHLQQLDVKAGQRVEKGEVVGLVGSTGRSTGPHLHYEVLVGETPINPRHVLWER